jgi:hypothetical protein
MLKLIKCGYECPVVVVCEMQTEAMLCASTELEDLVVKDTQDWGWED